MNKTEKLMKGWVQEDDFFIVHNNFVVNDSKGNYQMDEKNGYLHTWLLNLKGLQDGTHHVVRPVGNIPEFMCHTPQLLVV